MCKCVHTDRQRQTEIDRETKKYGYTEKARQRDRQQIERQSDRQTDGETETETESNWLLACLLNIQQHASVSQGWICSDNSTCCHTETEVADQTFHLTRSQSTDTGPTSPSTDPLTPGAWQRSHWCVNF